MNEFALVPLKIAELANSLGASPVNQYSGAWEYQIDDAWKVAVNGHEKPVMVDGLELPPFHILVWYNGWPAGIMTPYDGEFAAGSHANEAEFLDVLDCAITLAQQ